MRIGGFAHATLFGTATYLFYNYLSKIDYQKINDYFLGDTPIEQKIIEGVGLTSVAAFEGLMVFYTIDGLVDTILGTQHLLAMKTAKILSRNPERKQDLEVKIQNQLEM